MASSYGISGSGFAIAKMNGSLFIDWTISFVRIFLADTPMKTSLFFISSLRVSSSRLGDMKILSSISSCSKNEYILYLESCIEPLRLNPYSFLIPISLSNLAILLPAAPVPEITTSKSSIFLFVSLQALIRAANVTIAVPCWSSWKTGISSSFFSLRSI